MSLENGTIHYPKNPDLFEFDEEVAKVFDDMAARSIPMYEAAHRAHIQYLLQSLPRLRTLACGRPLRFLDVGASTGKFFSSLYEALGGPSAERLPNIHLYAVDPCDHMLDRVKVNVPHTTTYCMGAEEIFTLPCKFDVVNVSYVLQFIPPQKHYSVLKDIYNQMQPGGILFFSQKESIQPDHAHHFEEQYINFRRNNGYTDAEIEAKTKALRGSMWPQRYEQTAATLTRVGFTNIQETTRWLNFSSLVALAG